MQSEISAVHNQIVPFIFSAKGLDEELRILKLYLTRQIDNTMEENKLSILSEPPKKKLKCDYVTNFEDCLDKLRNSESNLRPVVDDSLSKPIPLTKVYIGVLKTVKDISKAILALNEKLPLKDLQHLKRAKKKEIILCTKKLLDGYTVEEYLNLNIVELKDCFESITEIEVPASPAKTKSQYENSNNIWPCNFHPNKYYEKLVSSSFFDCKELSQHRKYMEIAFHIVKFYTKHDDNILNSNTAVIVDPSIQSIVAVAFDNRNIHPIQHAAMLAIDNVGKTQNGGAWVNVDQNLDSSLKGIDNKVYEYLKNQFPYVKYGSKPFRSKKDMPNKEINEATDFGPYLCTGYDIYLIREPCVMCSMGLVHARVKRVFYCFKNEELGALESMVKLQTISSLNHHFEVFTGFI